MHWRLSAGASGAALFMRRAGVVSNENRSVLVFSPKLGDFVNRHTSDFGNLLIIEYTKRQQITDSLALLGQSPLLSFLALFLTTFLNTELFTFLKPFLMTFLVTFTPGFI